VNAPPSNPIASVSNPKIVRGFMIVLLMDWF
jgi:hypothetical protein